MKTAPYRPNVRRSELVDTHEREAAGITEDPLGPSQGVLRGIGLGALLWTALIVGGLLAVVMR